MSRKEEIVNAARAYNSTIAITLANHTNVLHFEAGAKWADQHPNLESLWHDVSDEPSEENVYIIAIDENGIPDTFKVQEGRKYYFHSWFIDWKELVENIGIKHWCYLENILCTK